MTASLSFQIVRLALAALLALSYAGAATLEECRTHDLHGRRDQAAACYRALLNQRDSYLRAEALWGLDRRNEANDEFRQAVNRDGKNPLYRTRWGRLLLEGNNKADADQLFREALAIDKDFAPAYVGMALVGAEDFDKRAVELAQKAVELDPELVEARELLARLALEDVDPDRAAREAKRALAKSPNALNAMTVLAAIDLLAGRNTNWLDEIAKVNPVYGEGYALLGHLFVLNRRYEEGIGYYRKAIALEPDRWRAHAELGVNLMRLGEEKEARRHLELCYENGHRDAKTVNTLRLMDSYKNFQTFRAGNTIVRLDKKEAALLRPYVQGELKRAVETFEKKYKFPLDRPIQLEVYPNHEDFAVRTMGMPGLGALGVTFGYVVAMDSPSGRRPGSFHWASTLWHELSHVFVLGITKHRIPRWFTEGLAVHEETAVSPEWGDRMTTEVIQAIKEKKLLPVADLDRGFIRPDYPAQVSVSYFQAGQICDYIVEKWGFDKLLGMMHSYAALESTDKVFETHLGISPEQFDKQFLAHLESETRSTIAGFEEWRKAMKGLAPLVRAKSYDEIIARAPKIRDLYPEYVEGHSVYEILADAYLAKGDKAAATAELLRYRNIGGRDPDTLKKLAKLQEEAGQKAAAVSTLQRINWIYPVDQELHQRLGRLYMDQNQYTSAIREFSAVIAMNPQDKAAAHYDLALAYRKANNKTQAEEQVLLALEAAPGFRPAQKLLLELNR